MNVIILTTGLSGSSLITGLIAQGGFWCGDTTVYKHNASGRYETYENSRLVELNDLIVKQTGYNFTDSAWYDKYARTIFEEFALVKSEKTNIFSSFLDRRRVNLSASAFWTVRLGHNERNLIFVLIKNFK